MEIRRRPAPWEKRAAVLLGGLGLLAVAWQQRRFWQRDQQRLAAPRPAPPPPPAEWPEAPLVSVLVAAWNEAAHIERHIKSFLALRYPHKELVLCAGGGDGTCHLARQYAGPTITVLEQHPGEGKQHALQRSLPHARGNIIYLTDADCLLDDTAFEILLHPLVTGAEQVTTGSSRPWPEQLDHPFVFTQVAGHIYSDLQAPAYAPGLLGQNSALRRCVLAETDALTVPAPTGTDYVLAKELNRHGVAIRHLPHSHLATHYHTRLRPYWRQQRRWLRNVALYGRRYAAYDEMRASLQTSLVGLLMLLLPLAALWLGPLLAVLWLLLFVRALLARGRYLLVAGAKLDRSLTFTDWLWQPPLLFLDFVAWIKPLPDYLWPQRRCDW